MEFLDAYLEQPFGSRSKSETDLLIFAALVSRGDVDPSASAFSIASRLHITKSKARSLLYSYQIRIASDQSPEFGGLTFTPQLAQCFRNCEFVYETPYITLTIDNQLSREALQDQLEDLDFVVEFGQNRNNLKITPEALFVIVGRHQWLMSDERMNSIPDSLSINQLNILKSEAHKKKDHVLRIIEASSKVAGLNDIFAGLKNLIAEIPRK